MPESKSTINSSLYFDKSKDVAIIYHSPITVIIYHKKLSKATTEGSEPLFVSQSNVVVYIYHILRNHSVESYQGGSSHHKRSEIYVNCSIHRVFSMLFCSYQTQTKFIAAIFFLTLVLLFSLSHEL